MGNLLIILTVLQTFLAGLDGNTLATDFSISVSEQTSQSISYSGKITMHGEKFLLSAFGSDAAYDGKTLYVYNEDLDELTLSNPTEQELLESNPLLFARALYKQCNITERLAKDNVTTIITLTPKNAGTGIKRMVLRVKQLPAAKTTQSSATDALSAATATYSASAAAPQYIPVMIEVVEDGKNTTLQMKNAQYISKQPAWKIEKEGAYLNDLR